MTIGDRPQSEVSGSQAIDLVADRVLGGLKGCGKVAVCWDGDVRSRLLVSLVLADGKTNYGPLPLLYDASPEESCATPPPNKGELLWMAPIRDTDSLRSIIEVANVDTLVVASSPSFIEPLLSAVIDRCEIARPLSDSSESEVAACLQGLDLAENMDKTSEQIANDEEEKLTERLRFLGYH